MIEKIQFKISKLIFFLYCILILTSLNLDSTNQTFEPVSAQTNIPYFRSIQLNVSSNHVGVIMEIDFNSTFQDDVETFATLSFSNNSQVEQIYQIFTISGQEDDPKSINFDPVDFGDYNVLVELYYEGSLVDYWTNDLNITTEPISQASNQTISSSNITSSPQGLDFSLTLIIILIISAVGFIVFQKGRKADSIAKGNDFTTPKGKKIQNSFSQPSNIEKVIALPCMQCGTLNAEKSKYCLSCGTFLK